jgi:hypothetical protein
VRQRDGEDLIRPAARVVAASVGPAAFRVDDVVKVAAVGKPEAIVERPLGVVRARALAGFIGVAARAGPPFH